jgi:ArsR family transcriptional regulator, arsenate/arsenite/antimonite-responsive transcriptional repressor / arsenate reductase (thioredoxin)
MGRADMGTQPSPLAFLRVVGHPLRWRLLRELARSDRQVRELVMLVDAPQNLVSYHLGRLGAHGLVTTRRSSADRRHAYYSTNLARCGELLGDVGMALHPGLRLAPGAPAAAQPPTAAGRASVLFLCTGNSARSQMAEGFLEHVSGNTVEVHSAGSHPSSLHPNAVKVMAGYGVNLAGRPTKHVHQFTQQQFDYVVTLCDRVREICPTFPGHPEPIHWSIPNPSEAGNSDQETYPAFQRVAAELAIRVPFLLQLITSADDDPTW